MCVLAIETEQLVKEVQLVEATPADFKVLKETKRNYRGEIEPIYGYRYGVPFWLKSQVTEKLEDHVYIFSADTYKEEFAEYLRLNMVFIPVNCKQELM